MQLMQKVREFRDKALDVSFDDTRAFEYTDKDRRTLAVRLISQEFGEYAKAEHEDDLVEIADALGDLIYVCAWTALEYGIDLDEVFDEIHRSNMTKTWPDGTFHKDSGGKVMKPDTFEPPNILGVM
jgi:predicted HAD superfamily Cof-like phosphohydrolase